MDQKLKKVRAGLNYRERMKCARSECYDPTLTLSVNGQKVKQVDKIKFLGVIIDDQLSWNDQIKYVENKLMSTIVLIKRKKKFIPSSHYFKIYLVCDWIENSDRTGTDWDHFDRNRTGPDFKPKKFNRIDRIGRIFTVFFKL